jgi:hypothetical protein
MPERANHFRGRGKRTDMTGQTLHQVVKGSFRFVFIAALFLITSADGLCQGSVQEGSVLRIGIGNVSFQVREVQASPAPIRILDVQVEVMNQSQTDVVPAQTLKAVVQPKEVTYPPSRTSNAFPLGGMDFVINQPPPPGTGRLVIFSFSLPGERPESITFEIQVNPPAGPRKSAVWR